MATTAHTHLAQSACTLAANGSRFIVQRVVHVATLATASALIFVSGCGKSDREPTTEERLKAVQQRQETTTDFSAPRKRVDYLADLKNLKDLPIAEKGKPSAPEPKAAPVPTPAPVLATPAPIQAAPARVTPAAVTPPQATQTAPVATQTAPATPAPTPAAGAPVSRAADTAVTVVNREQPTFPREAIRQGVESGVVRARATIGVNGEVKAVTIVSSKPARVFDREVQATLSRWRFNAGADGRTYETEINFQR